MFAGIIGNDSLVFSNTSVGGFLATGTLLQIQHGTIAAIGGGAQLLHLRQHRLGFLPIVPAAGVEQPQDSGPLWRLQQTVGGRQQDRSFARIVGIARSELGGRGQLGVGVFNRQAVDLGLPRRAFAYRPHIAACLLCLQHRNLRIAGGNVTVARDECGTRLAHQRRHTRLVLVDQHRCLVESVSGSWWRHQG